MAARGVIQGDDGRERCWWGADPPDYRVYHDREWGRPQSGDIRLFEKICLEGFQAGLSWLTILRKREAFRSAFAGFDFRAMARFNTRSVERLLRDSGIVRHRGKIEAAIQNAKRVRELVDEFGSLGAYLWSFEPKPRSRSQALTRASFLKLAQTPDSKALSDDLRRRGWRFVGPTTMYAFMQAMGMVNDHLPGCAFYRDVEAARRKFRRPR